MTEGYQPSAPPAEQKRRGRKPKDPSAPPKRYTRQPKPAANGEVDSLSFFLDVSSVLDQMPVKARRALMKALNERFPE